MCGICGVLGKAPAHQKRMLSYLNESRGHDSVGFYYLAEPTAPETKFEEKSDILQWILPNVNIPQVGEKSPRVHKYGTSIISAFRRPDFDSSMFDSDLFLCHTRAASSRTGGVNSTTAHPFRSGHIIGAHNGYISNYNELISQYSKTHPELKNVQVDSELIFFMLNLKGFKGLRELCGSASAWFVDDRQPQKVFLWVNDQTLHIFKKPGIRAFSSAADPIILSGFTPGPIDKSEECFRLDDKGQVVSLDLVTLKDSKVGNFPGKERAVTTTSYGNWNSADARGFGSYTQPVYSTRAIPGFPQTVTGFDPANRGDYNNPKSCLFGNLNMGQVAHCLREVVTSQFRDNLPWCPRCKDLIVTMPGGPYSFSFYKNDCPGCDAKDLKPRPKHTVFQALYCKHKTVIDDVVCQVFAYSTPSEAHKNIVGFFGSVLPKKWIRRMAPRLKAAAFQLANDDGDDINDGTTKTPDNTEDVEIEDEEFTEMVNNYFDELEDAYSHETGLEVKLVNCGEDSPYDAKAFKIVMPLIRHAITKGSAVHYCPGCEVLVEPCLVMQNPEDGLNEMGCVQYQQQCPFCDQEVRILTTTPGRAAYVDAWLDIMAYNLQLVEAESLEWLLPDSKPEELGEGKVIDLNVTEEETEEAKETQTPPPLPAAAESEPELTVEPTEETPTETAAPVKPAEPRVGLRLLPKNGIQLPNSEGRVRAVMVPNSPWLGRIVKRTDFTVFADDDPKRGKGVIASHMRVSAVLDVAEPNQPPSLILYGRPVEAVSANGTVESLNAPLFRCWAKDVIPVARIITPETKVETSRFIGAIPPRIALPPARVPVDGPRES